MPTPNGYVLAEFPNYVVIATGINRPSENAKTGPMIQVRIIVRDQDPTQAIMTGRDTIVCLDCIHRGVEGFKSRTCYVNVLWGENAVYKSYRNGAYPFLPLIGYPPVFTGRSVRLGTYGEPCLIPLGIIRETVRYASNWTGYTHQWGRIDPEYSRYLMASCDSESQAFTARELGYRTFRVRVSDDTPHMVDEIECPNYTHGTQCIDCGLCQGNSKIAKNIAILAHGSGAKYLAAKLVNIL